MQKILLILLCTAIYLLGTFVGYGDEYEKFEIKQGLHKSSVNEKYGSPLLVEKLKSGFLPVPREKALYRVGDSTYMILFFFSGRINEITILDEMTYEDAVSMFGTPNKKS